MSSGDHTSVRQTLRLAKALLGADLVVAFRWVGEGTAQIVGVHPEIVPVRTFSLSRARIDSADGFLLETERPRSLLSTALLAHLEGEPSGAAVIALPADGRGSGLAAGMLAAWLAPEAPDARRLRGSADELRAALAEGLRGGPEEVVLDRLTARLDAVMNAIPQAVVFIDDEPGGGFINDPAAELLGVPSDTAEPDRLAGAMRALRARARNREEIEKHAAALFPNPNFQVRRWGWEYDDPAPRFLDVTSVPVHAGQVSGRLWVFEDVTEERLSHAKLERRRQEFRLLVENSPDIIARLDREFRRTYVNPAVERVVGIRPAAFLGKTNEEMGMEAAHAAVWREQMRQVVETGEERQIEFTHESPRGTVWLQARVVPEFGPDGEVVSLLEITRDFTELRRAEAHYRRLVTTSPYGVFAMDREGRFTEANPAMEEIVGRAAAEMLGRHVSEVLDPGDPRRAETAFARLTSGAEPMVDLELRVRRPSGEQRLLNIVATPVTEGSEVLGLHGTSRDITEEWGRQVQLRRAERLASMGTLLSGVAHELNNPLHAILNFAQLLRIDEENPERRDDLGLIEHEANRMAKIVSDLKQIARDTQEEAAEKGPVDLNAVVRQVLKIHGYRLRTSNVEVREDLAEELPPVWADRGQIEQVILNLVVNAEQAMVGARGEGRLILRTRRTPTGAAVSVVDDGPGIPAGHLERIFDPFFTTKSPGEGTGLGLSLAHSIVTEHGGEIRVDSEVGSGTAFWVSLPRAPESPASAPGEAGPDDGPPRPLRVLVVDDEPTVRRALARFLGQRGHSVELAAEGGEALRKLGAGAFDVVVSDLRMPGLSGEALVLRLREEGFGGRIVCMTGDAVGGGAERIRAQAGVAVLLKPIPLPEIARVVEDPRAAPDGRPPG